MNPFPPSEPLTLSVSAPTIFKWRIALPHYGAAVASIAGTAFIRLLLDGSLEDKNRFIIYLPAVLFSAWYGGFVPGVLAFLMGGVAGVLVYGSPAFTFHWADPSNSLGLLLYFVAGGCIVFWVRAQSNIQYQTQVKQERLEGAVLERERAAEQHTQLLAHEQKARAEADKSNAMKSQFVGMVAHELRTPLTLIKGFASSMVADDVVWELDDQRKFLHIIDEEADRLNELIDQLLDLTQIQSGKMRVHTMWYSLGEIFAHAQSSMESLAQKHHLILNISKTLPIIMVDPQRLAQVLLNLVGNAAKYSPPDGTITVTAQIKGAEIQVDVADEGAGIPLPLRAMVFEAYRQVDDVIWRSIKGSGLGLAICKGLIEAHGGRIWVGDQATTGTIVSFTLPIADSTLA
ncbi:MAG: ATP-binding protein [Chloroflexota bacterium]